MSHPDEIEYLKIVQQHQQLYDQQYNSTTPDGGTEYSSASKSRLSKVSRVTTASDMSISTIDDPSRQDNIHPLDSVSNRDAQSEVPDSDYEMRSVVSFNSEVDGNLFKEIHGRTYNNLSDNYMLPADDDEYSRLDIQHGVMKLILGGRNYQAPEQVRAALAPNPHQRPAVIDLGTGSGRWAIEMALEFPHAEVVGLDLAPPTLTGVSHLPDNCRFEVDDASFPMDHYTNSFNVVHMRAMEVGIQDFDQTLYYVAKMLRPNGVLLLSSVPPQFRDASGNRLPTVDEGEPGYSALQRLFTMCAYAYRNRGNLADHPCYWHRWLVTNPNYRDVHTEDILLPVGDWEENLTPARRRAAEMMRHDVDQILPAFKPLLLTDRYPEEYIDHLMKEASAEMRDHRVKCYAPWIYTTAIRTEIPYGPRNREPTPKDPNFFQIGPLISKHGRFIQQLPEPPETGSVVGGTDEADRGSQVDGSVSSVSSVSYMSE